MLFGVTLLNPTTFHCGFCAVHRRGDAGGYVAAHRETVLITGCALEEMTNPRSHLPTRRAEQPCVSAHLKAP
jgi:hypothetical protein